MASSTSLICGSSGVTLEPPVVVLGSGLVSVARCALTAKSPHATVHAQRTLVHQEQGRGREGTTNHKVASRGLAPVRRSGPMRAAVTVGPRSIDPVELP